jgi:hypothetical protein
VAVLGSEKREEKRALYSKLSGLVFASPEPHISGMCWILDGGGNCEEVAQPFGFI